MISLETSTSHNERFILISNSIIGNIGALGGVDVFRLYVELLLQKNWRNEVTTTPNLLLKKLERSKQYWEKQMRVQLQTLIDKKIISVGNNIENAGINDYMTITVLIISGPATEIKCVNEELFCIQDLVSSNVLFAVFAFIKQCTDRDVGYARVAMSTIADGLDLSVKTIEKSIKILEDNGFLRVIRGIYDPVTSKKANNKYRVYDYNSLMWKVKHGLASLSERQTLSESEQAEAEIERKISEVLSNPAKFAPCVFKNMPAMMFFDYYSSRESAEILVINSIVDMASVMDGYDGILSVPGGVMVLFFENLTDGIEDYIVAFLKNSILPVIILLDYEVEITNNNLKSLLRYEFY